GRRRLPGVGRGVRAPVRDPLAGAPRRPRRAAGDRRAGCGPGSCPPSRGGGGLHRGPVAPGAGGTAAGPRRPGGPDRPPPRRRRCRGASRPLLGGPHRGQRRPWPGHRGGRCYPGVPPPV
ncbi:MAG: Guanylate kinase, partial [uncultured Acidimicrobiales bacterium]